MNDINLFKELGYKYETDKISHHGYHFIYPTFLSSYKNEEFNLLEIGYSVGGSHNIWKEYFPNAKIFSADIDPHPNNNHSVYKCDQSNPLDLLNIINDIKTAKIIVDDGSHHPLHQMESFHILFQNLLCNGGTYIIEDIECNYWKCDSNISKYKIGTSNCIDFTKKFIDQINQEFSGVKNKYMISSVTYSQNCIIIKKQTDEEINFFNRSYRYQHNI